MPESQKHSIEKLVFEIATATETEAHRLKNEVSGILHDDVLPHLEQVLDELNTDGQIFRFDKIELNISLENWKNSAALNRALEKQLRNNLMRNSASAVSFKTSDDEIADRKPQTIKPAENRQYIFLYFLEFACLPWYARKEQIDELFLEDEWNKALQNSKFTTSLVRLLAGNNTARKRFVMQIPFRRIIDFLEQQNKINFANINHLHTVLTRSEASFRNQFLELLVKRTVLEQNPKDNTDLKPLICAYVATAHKSKTKKTNEELLSQFDRWLQKIFGEETFANYFRLQKTERDALVKQIEQLQKARNQRGELTRNNESTIENDPTIHSDGVSLKTEKEPPFFDAEIQSLAVQNAGQVLFHPYLSTLFKRLLWLNPQGQIAGEFQQVAVQMLHYCATGNDHFFEAHLVLEKLLCGVSLQMPVPAESLLPKNAKNEANSMLKQLIAYWPELKNTSVGGLRDMFFRRDGKLVQKGKDYRLIVERKAQDVLLEKLQWNISVVKMPWQNQLLFVEW